jgi:hypothetical protein
VRIDYLPPIETKNWKRADLRNKSREVRNQFLRYLPPAANTKDYDAELDSESTTATN